jgi:hypothetical protein
LRVAELVQVSPGPGVRRLIQAAVEVSCLKPSIRNPLADWCRQPWKSAPHTKPISRLVSSCYGRDWGCLAAEESWAWSGTSADRCGQRRAGPETGSEVKDALEKAEQAATWTQRKRKWRGTEDRIFQNEILRITSIVSTYKILQYLTLDCHRFIKNIFPNSCTETHHSTLRRQRSHNDCKTELVFHLTALPA